jgi:hypothetical protein
MLTPDQLQAIVDSRVALLKQYAQGGELRKFAGNPQGGKLPWPEFWVGYNQAVKERDELAVHIEYGVFPEHLIRSRSPNQTDAEFQYVKDNFKQVTLPNSIDFLNTISRADSNWRIEYRDEDSDIQTYLTDRIGELGDFTLWANDLLPKMKILDPMGIICTMPVRIPVIEGHDEAGEPVLVIDPNTQVEPQPNYFPVERVWGYDHGVWYCLLTTEKSRVKKGGLWKMEGYVMWIVDDEKCYRVAQFGDAEKFKFEIQEYFEHGQGYPPCIFLMGTPTLKEGKVIYQSCYLPSKPAFDTVLLDTTYLMMVKSNSAYPARVMLGNDCEYVTNDMGRCVGGDLTYALENGGWQVRGKCPNCKGTGITARLGPNGVLFVHAMKRGDTASPSVHDAMTFVEPTATTMDFLRREIVDQTNEGRRVMHLSAEAPMAGGEVKTATQSGLDNKSTIAFIRPIANQLFAVRAFTADSMAIQRYGKEAAEGMVKIVPATSFDLRTESDYMAEWMASSTLPPPLRQLALEGYINTRHAGDASMKEALEAIILADRLFVLSAMEIAQLNPRPEAWELALHNEALGIYERLSQDKSFMALDKFAKADAIKTAAKEANGAAEVPQEQLATKLIGAANTVPTEKGKVVRLNAQAQTDSTVADTSLNGAQIAALIEVINQVSLGIISKETALPLIQAAFPGIDDASITRMLAGVKSIKPGATNAPTTDIKKAVPTV